MLHRRPEFTNASSTTMRRSTTNQTCRGAVLACGEPREIRVQVFDQGVMRRHFQRPGAPPSIRLSSKYHRLSLKLYGKGAYTLLELLSQIIIF